MQKLFDAFKSNLASYPKLLEVLSQKLGVSTKSLQTIGVGINPHSQSWVFPERNEKGDIIGLAQRRFDGKKLMVKGSKRGLTYVLNQVQSGEQYVKGKHNWQRVSKTILCPICGKSDGCLVPAGNPPNPTAVVCVHISEGATKKLELGYLHILDSKRNVGYGKNGTLLPSDSPILIVEGASDVAAAMDLGFVAVGRPSAEGGMALLQKILVNRKVVIVGENDSGAGKRGMEAAFHTLKSICKSTIKILPPENIKDLRDWKNNYELTQVNLMDYVNQTGDESTDPDIFESDIAHTIAGEWLRREKTIDGKLSLYNHQGQWAEYTKNRYENLNSFYFRGQLYNFLDGKLYKRVNTRNEVVFEPYRPTRAKINDIIDALSQWCSIVKDAPVWLSKDDRPDPIDLIVFQNGILDVQKYLNGEICLYDSTPELFTFNALPYDFDENLESKIWDDFVNDIFNNEQDKVSLLAQWFGYNCIPDLSYEKLMLFTGRPRSGKSTVLEAMQAMLGEEQCCETSFQSLTGPFGYQPLLGKYTAIIGDAKSPKSNGADAVLEKILHITGGDAVSVNRKNVTELPMVHLKCRFTIAMNDLPAFTDHARALEPRLNILVFENSYLGKEDRTLKRRLRQEAQQGKLINFALRGLKSLREQKDFIVPKSSTIAMRQFQELASPTVTFVAECCEFQPPDSREEYTVTKDQLYEIWQLWCSYQGRKPGVKQQFGKWFLSACPQVITERMRKGTEKRQYVFRGVRLASWVFKEYLGRQK